MDPFEQLQPPLPPGFDSSRPDLDLAREGLSAQDGLDHKHDTEEADLCSLPHSTAEDKDLLRTSFEEIKTLLETRHESLTKEELLLRLEQLTANYSNKFKFDSPLDPAIFNSLEKFEHDFSIEDCRTLLYIAQHLRFKSPMTERLQDRLIEGISPNDIESARRDFRDLVQSNSLSDSQKQRILEKFTPVIYEMPKFSLLKTLANDHLARLGSVDLLRALAGRVSSLVDDMTDSNLTYALNNLRGQAKHLNILNHDYRTSELPRDRKKQNFKDQFLLPEWQQEKLVAEVEKRLDLLVTKPAVAGDHGWKNILLMTKALVELGEHRPNLVKKLCHRFAESYQDFTAQEGLLLLSLIDTKADVRASDMERIVNNLDRTVENTEFSTLLAVSSQLVRLHLNSKKFFEGISKLPNNRLDEMSPGEAVGLLRSQAKLNEVNLKLLENLDRIISTRNQDVTNLGKSLAWFAQLRVVPPQLLNCASGSIISRLSDPSFESFQIASILRSLTVLDTQAAKEFWSSYQATELSYNGMEKPRLLDDIQSLNSINLCSIYHSLVVLDLEVPREMSERIRRLKHHDDFGVPELNNLEKSIGSRLRYLQIPARPQVWFEGLYLDFLIESRDLKIALECDGRSYHVADGKLNGSTWLHTQFLEKRGFIVVRLDSSDWLRADEAGKHKILKDALKCYLY